MAMWIPSDVNADEVYLRPCPDNGKSPWDHPADKSVDPENCPGD